MGIEYILAMAAAVCIARILKKTSRQWLLLVFSVFAVFQLQPTLPIRGLDFWLPVLTIGLAVTGWNLTRPPGRRWKRVDWITLAVAGGMILLLGLTREFELPFSVTASRPPQLIWILFFLVVIGGLSWGLERVRGKTGILWAAVIVLVMCLLVLKNPDLATLASAALRWINNQDLARADALDIRWLGVSYIAFRLIHTMRDRQLGKLVESDLQEYITYIIFFPTLVAGPIDRLERFLKDVRAEDGSLPDDTLEAGKRLTVGIFKKFVLADGLAIFALNGINAVQVEHSGWLWIMLYAYALQIYFDFSGYTDIAIGLSQVIGIRLPENFQAPYLKPNLTLFWNNWHITLTQWFRGYFFNPLTRWMRRARWDAWFVLLVGQLSTMLLIGLWHGVTWNFITWGIWHGVGLFLQNRWSEWVAPRLYWLENKPRLNRAIASAGVFLTFHYVAIGWVWFVLPTPDLALRTLMKLVGWN